MGRMGSGFQGHYGMGSVRHEDAHGLAVAVVPLEVGNRDGRDGTTAAWNKDKTKVLRSLGPPARTG